MYYCVDGPRQGAAQAGMTDKQPVEKGLQEKDVLLGLMHMDIDDNKTIIKEYSRT